MDKLRALFSWSTFLLAVFFATSIHAAPEDICYTMGMDFLNAQSCSQYCVVDESTCESTLNKQFADATSCTSFITEASCESGLNKQFADTASCTSYCDTCTAITEATCETTLNKEFADVVSCSSYCDSITESTCESTLKKQFADEQSCKSFITEASCETNTNKQFADEQSCNSFITESSCETNTNKQFADEQSCNSYITEPSCETNINKQFADAQSCQLYVDNAIQTCRDNPVSCFGIATNKPGWDNLGCTDETCLYYDGTDGKTLRGRLHLPELRYTDGQDTSFSLTDVELHMDLPIKIVDGQIQLQHLSFYAVDAITDLLQHNLGQTLSLTTNGEGIVSASAIDTLNLTCVDDGAQTGGDCAKVYKQNTAVTVNTIPITNSQFDRWEGDCVELDNPASLTMDKDISCTAIFTPQTSQDESTLDVKVEPDTTAGAVSTTSIKGQQVTLFAQATTGYEFIGWEDCSTDTTAQTIVLLDQNRTCIARFGEVVVSSALLTISLNDADIQRKLIVRDIDNSTSIACGAVVGQQTCEFSYQTDTSINLIAEIDGQPVSVDWGDCNDDSAGDTTTAVPMDADKTCSISLL